MGNVLFIRVSAQTYSENAMRKAWPRLCHIVFPDDGPMKPGDFGREKTVLDLITSLAEGVRFSLFSKEVLPLLETPSLLLEDLARQLESALGDHDVPRAKQLTNAIELALEKAEDALPKK